jgi:hypothetical protein
MFLGGDHLLCVDSSGYAEEYRRFYYADIQAVLVRKTQRGGIWTMVWSILTVVPALIALGLTGAGADILWSFAGFGLLCLLVNISRGPTCVAHLRTAVHLEELPSLHRLRVARNVLALLRPLVEQAQGVVAPEQIGRHLATLAQTSEGASAIGSAPGGLKSERSGPKGASAYEGRFHWILFALLLVGAAATGIILFVQHVVLFLISFLIMVALTVCTVMALVRQQGSPLSRWVKGATWAALVYLGLSFALGYVHFIVLIMQNPGIAHDQWQFLELLAGLSPFDSPWYLGLLLYSLAASLGLGLVGILALRERGPLERSQPDNRMPSLPVASHTTTTDR